MTLLLLGMLTGRADGLSMQRSVHIISGRSCQARPACWSMSLRPLNDKDARLCKQPSFCTQALAAMTAAILSSSGVTLMQPLQAPAYAAVEKPSAVDMNALFKLAFEESETLYFSELGWGDAETAELSKALFAAKKLKKLYLNGNAIGCDGATSLAVSLRDGAAPKLKMLNLAGNRGISETDKRALKESREGLTVTVVPLKQASDAAVYKLADDNSLIKKDVIARAEKGQLVDGSGATCTELSRIIEVDRSALEMERAKLENKVGVAVFSTVNPEQLKKVGDIEKRVQNQVDRLEKLLAQKERLRTTKGC